MLESITVAQSIFFTPAEAVEPVDTLKEEVIRGVRERFIPITHAHTILALNDQYARRKVLDYGVPEQDYFEVWGRYLVDRDFLIRLRDEMQNQ
jgi:hypothetical protein